MTKWIYKIENSLEDKNHSASHDLLAGFAFFITILASLYGFGF